MVGLRSDHVAMSVGHDDGRAVALHAFGDQKRTGIFDRVRMHFAGKAKGRESWNEGLVQIVGQLRRPGGRLAFR